MLSEAAIPRTALAASFAGSEARMGTYAGAETPAGFGNTAAEFAAITRSCGVYDLGWRAKLKVTGDDRVRWLNGMVTNNIRDLAPDGGNYNFLLTAQGRIVGDLYIYNRGEHLLFDTERAQLSTIHSTLDRFIIMDDVELDDISDTLTSIGIQGPHADDILRKAGIDPAGAEPMTVRDEARFGAGVSITRMASPEFLTYELWLEPERAAEIWNALVEAGAQRVGFEALEQFRIAAGIPRYGQDITERTLPQETGQEHALNFSKGCYIGQEIVERIRARGQVHRIFSGIEFSAPVERSAKVQFDGKDVGELTSVTSIPTPSGERHLGLGYLRREHAAPRTRVIAAGVSGAVSKLPFEVLHA